MIRSRARPVQRNEPIVESSKTSTAVVQTSEPRVTSSNYRMLKANAMRLQLDATGAKHLEAMSSEWQKKNEDFAFKFPPEHGRCVIHLLAHYPCIVYLAYRLCRGCLRLVEHGDSSGEPHPDVLDLHQNLPKVFMQYRIPLNPTTMVAYGGQELGAFKYLNRLLKTSYPDLALLLITEFQLDLNDRLGESGPPLVHLLIGAKVTRCIPLVKHLLLGGCKEEEKGIRVPPVDLEVRDADNNTLLQLSAKNCDLEMIELLLSLGAHPDPVDQTLEPTPLLSIITPNNVNCFEMVKALLKAGANVNAKGCSQGSGRYHYALHLAVRHCKESLKLVELLLASDADVNASDDDGNTPLLLVLKEHQTQPQEGSNPLLLTKALLAAGADVNLKCTRSWTALHRACRRGLDPEIVELLLAAGADVNASAERWNQKTALMVLVEENSPTVSEEEGRLLSIADALLAAGADVNLTDGHSQTALHHVKCPGIVPRLLAAGANVNALDQYGRTPLALRLVYKPFTSTSSMVKVLVAVGADLNATDSAGNTPLIVMLTSQGWKEHTLLPTANVLLTAGAKVNLKGASGKTALHHAVVNGMADVMRCLLSAGAQVDALDDGDRTPFSFVLKTTFSSRSKCRLMKVLIAAGADVNARNHKGETALHDVKEDSDVLQLLIEAGADVNAKATDGSTPLEMLIEPLNLSMIEALLAAGAKVNLKGAFGQTVLHCACAVKRASSALVRYLLAHGADPEIRDDYGRTPLYYALHHDDYTGIGSGNRTVLEIKEMLKEKMAAHE